MTSNGTNATKTRIVANILYLYHRCNHIKMKKAKGKPTAFLKTHVADFSN